MRAVLLHPYRTAAASLVLCAAFAAAGFGTGIDGLQAVTRYTGRAGLVLFAMVFMAGPLHRLAPGAWTKLAVARRRSLGLAFGAHHLVHLALVLAFLHFAGRELDAGRAAGGAAGYVALLLMMCTSTDRARRALGARAWSMLHRTSLWYLWIVFMITYVSRLQGKVDHPGGSTKEFVVCATILAAIGVARVLAIFRKPARRAAPLPSEA